MLDSEPVEFEDDIFKAYCTGNFDYDGNGEVCKSEAAVVKAIDCSNYGITSLKGIECFTSLEILHCESNRLTALDVSECNALNELTYDENSIEHVTCNFPIGHLIAINGKNTVVCAVTGEGYRKLLLLQLGGEKWDNSGEPIFCGATSMDDGRYNTDMILSKTGSCNAAKWSRSHGINWYMPAINELKDVYEHRSVIFRIAEEAVMELNIWTYSSTEQDGEGNAVYYCNINSGEDYRTAEKNKYPRNVWAMKLL